MKGRGSVFNYYTYRNFTKLVEKGTGFWEAVVNVPDGLTAGTNFAASLDAVPTLDEHGFSVIDAKLFCGSANEATIEDCVSMLKSRTLFPHWKTNRKPGKSNDDTHGKLFSLAVLLDMLIIFKTLSNPRPMRRSSRIIRHRSNRISCNLTSQDMSNCEAGLVKNTRPTPQNFSALLNMLKSTLEIR